MILFFLLSGFLIAGTTLNKPTSYNFANFVFDRGARIFVPYIPALAFLVAVGLLFRLDGPYDPATIMANMAMLQDYPLHRLIAWFPEFDRVGVGRPLWSVAMEWWLYMGFGAVFFFRRMPPWGWILAVPGLVVVSYNAIGGMLAITWFFAAGVAWTFDRLPKAPWALLCGAFALFAAERLKISPARFYDLQFTLLLGAALFSGLKAIEGWRPHQLVASAAAGCAAFSYTLYLVHYPFLSLTPGWQGFVWANLFAVAMWFLFERHYPVIAALLRHEAQPLAVRTVGPAPSDLKA